MNSWPRWCGKNWRLQEWKPPGRDSDPYTCSFSASPGKRMKIPTPDLSLPPNNLEAEEVAPSNTALAGRRSIAGNTFWNLLGNCFPVAVAVVCLPILKRGLGTERLGIISLAWVVIG